MSKLASTALLFVIAALPLLARDRGQFAKAQALPIPPSQTPWQELYRKTVGQLETGACVDFATGYVDIIARYGEPRHSH